MIATLLLALATPPVFEHARAIVPLTRAQATLVSVALPQSIDGGADATYADLRIVNDAGHDVPYALDPAAASINERAVALSDIGFVPSRYTEAIADFGSNPTEHDALTLRTSRETFFESVRIATSDDRRTWKDVGQTTIYRVAQHGDRGSQTLSYAPTHARYVRIRIMDGAAAFPIESAFAPAEAPSASLVTLTHHDTQSQAGHDTIVDVDTGTPHTDVAAATIDSTTPTFARDVDVQVGHRALDEYGASRMQFETLASGRVFRYTQGSPKLDLQTTMREQRFRIVVHNGNDAPLEALRVVLQGPAHRVVFRAEPGARYRLLWGADVAAPSYDLADQLAHSSWSAVPTTLMPGEAPTATSASGEEQSVSLVSRFAMPVALTLAALILAGIVIATLRRSPTA